MYEADRMLAFVPTPFADETLRSVAARWYALSGMSSPAVFLRAAFPGVIDFEAADLSRGTVVESSAGTQISYQELSEKHTLTPFFRHFIHPHLMVKLALGGPHVAAKRFLNSDLRYCVMCASEQRSREGVAVWLRRHNLPGVSVCSLHKVRLHRHEMSRHGLDLVPNDFDVGSVESSTSSEVSYAEDAYGLLKLRPSEFHVFRHLLLEIVQRRFPRRGGLAVGPHENSWNHELLCSDLSAAFPDLNCIDTRETNRLDAQAKVAGALRPGAQRIHPITAICIAHVCYSGGIQALIQDGSWWYYGRPKMESRLKCLLAQN